MPDQSDRLGLPYMLPSQAQKHVTHNEALRRLDALVQLTVERFGALTPPPAPETGTCYALGEAPAGDWAGQGGLLAFREADGWRFVAPREGWLAWGRAEAGLRVWGAGGWGPVPTGVEVLDRLGIAAAPDDTNRLAVASDATLLSHDGAGHRLKINKAGTAETASLLFQSGWTGHAEMGLTGGLAFAVKISPDGVGWSEAMRADPLTGQISWAPAGAVRMALGDAALQLDVPLTGSAVQAAPGDVTPGRLMRADYGYGPANLVGAVAQSGGSPAGAAIERGSNANGEYVRFADGTQICWHRADAVYASGSTLVAPWVFPAGFSGASRISLQGSIYVSTLSVTPAVDELLGANFASVSATSCSVLVRRVFGGTNFAASDTTQVFVTATGRWF